MKPARYLTTAQAVEEYGFASAHALRRAAKEPGGPPSIKLNRKILFDRVEMDAWIDSHRRQPQTAS